MIRVTVELVPFGIGEPVTIGQAETLKTDGRRGSYGFRFYGRRGKRLKTAGSRVRGYSRSKHVWHLVALALREAGFGPR